jgi:hypothetical protein
VRRLTSGLIALALVLVLIGVGVASDRAKAGAAATGQPPTRVSLFGDSLAYQSRAAFATRMADAAPGDLHVATYPTTAPCDFRGQIATDLVRRRPQVIVLEFSGNSFTPCMRDRAGQLLSVGSAAWRDRYVDDVRAVLAVAQVTSTTLVWATAPPVHHPSSPDDYPRRLAAAMRGVAATNHRLRVVDTGAAVAGSGRSFTRSLPCRPHERFCHAGRVVVRSGDGLHFDCHGAEDALMDCAGYSAGARRFGVAMADAAIAAGGEARG